MKKLINQIKTLLQINETKTLVNHDTKACNYADNYYGDQLCR
ncbi:MULTISPECIES: hypothetical protein [Thalassotalea]|uniref:Uncharacterized protein n=1 Tax=Thalassotalea castellviae TaxID=3075612 RepID=A0ABU3A4I3_9GAMM|nr:hypothetical protein [Thalassotalea sp. W431]MDT0604715.1 hypothetical protein [Thalassotalea sp. W431]